MYDRKRQGIQETSISKKEKKKEEIKDADTYIHTSSTKLQSAMFSEQHEKAISVLNRNLWYLEGKGGKRRISVPRKWSQKRSQ